MRNIFTTISLCFLIASLVCIQAPAAAPEKQDEFNCDFPGITIDKAKLLEAVGLPKKSDIKIAKIKKCQLKFRGEDPTPSQYFFDKASVSLRVEPYSNGNGLFIVVSNKELRPSIKSIHILYLLENGPHKLVSYQDYTGSAYKVEVTHVYGLQKPFSRCPDTIDYVVVVEFKKETGKTHIAHKYRAKNQPCSY